MSAGAEQRKLAAIFFTDMVGYSALAQRNEPLALELLEEHRRLLRPIFPQFNGREETAGDVFLVEFASALEARPCAVEIQRVLSERKQQSVIVVNPKIDLKTQRRLQCSLRFDDVFKHLEPGGNREAQAAPARWGVAFPAPTASKPREFTR
jgi:class 3 adenylate cyclase